MPHSFVSLLRRHTLSSAANWSIRFCASPTVIRTFSCSSVLKASSLQMEKVDTSQRLSELRKLMKDNKIDVWITPSEDAHQSEYTAACDGRRSYISGFSGSAGTAVISLEKAALATDGRYFNQAAKQLDNNWTLLKQGLEDVPTWQDWAAEQSEGGKVVGVDSTLVTPSEAKKLVEKIQKRGGKDLVGLTENLVDKVWGTKRPSRPREAVQVLDTKYAGKKFEEKINELRKELEKKRVSGMVVSMLDEIAWLFNLRGNDIEYNPVFFSYATITPTSATLYVDESKLNEDVKKHLGSSVQIRPYDSILGDLEALGQEASTTQGAAPKKILISNKASWALQQKLGGESKVEETRSPITDAKAIKNAVEMEGMRQCHIRDGAALSKFFAWLEEELIVKGTKLDEVQAADELEKFRKEQDLFVGLSFDTISSTGPNAAVIHYKPEPGYCSVVDPKQVYLCDSGAQYLDGTTDTTRTLHFGTPTEFEKKSYTLVLKGMIAVGGVVFPKGTNGMALDTMARQFLWREGLDYRHGTGHGVGSYLNVHEGPVGIGTRVAYAEVPLSVGNVISDEPGYYEDGNFGIRIENVIMVKEVKTTHSFGDKPWLSFEHVTMTPLCQKLIDVNLLTADEKKWANDYHQEIWDKTNGFFKNDERTTNWLKRECTQI